MNSKYKHPAPDEVRAILRRLELTQRAAAELLCLDPRTIRRYVSGDTVMQFPVVFTLICRVSGIKLEPGDWRQGFFGCFRS
jgi:hypothetical protein